jgi:7-carboxy-7-deazaguanine synthase
VSRVPRPAADGLLVSEVFSAIQGEAALVGERQVFLRLAGCNLRCAYCDQPEALEPRPGPCRLERHAGRRGWEQRDSPLAGEDVVVAVARLWEQVPHHSVSVTGGEPLLQARRLAPVVAALAGAGMPVMLETNGTFVGGLATVAPWLAWVSLDLKLPSVDGEHVELATQERFLATVLASGLAVWVKVVLGPTTDAGELERAIDAVARCAGDRRDVEVFLQPVTPFGAVAEAPSAEQVLELQERALRRYPRVRVVPQTHKAIGQL